MGQAVAGAEQHSSAVDCILVIGYRDGDRLAVVCCTPRDKAACGTLSVEGMRPVGGDAIVRLPANGITVLEFVKR